MLTSFDVADYLIWVGNTLSGSVTQLKLQKLVYYAQGFYLALYGDPLFAEDIVAWDHGPVIPALWQKYTCYGASPLPLPNFLDVSIYSESQILLLDGVFSKLGRCHPYALREKTHQEPTWINAYPQGVISRASMRTYFITRIHKDNLLELTESSKKISRERQPSTNSYSVKPETSNSSVESDIKKSKGFKAYLASKKKRFEVYRRLAEFVEWELAITIHNDLIETFGGSFGLRDEGLLESALSQPKATFFGDFLHGSISEQASAYVYHISRNHPFIDGNKRTALGVMQAFLGMNDYDLNLSDEELFDLVLAVSTGNLSKSELATILENHLVKALLNAETEQLDD